MGFPAHLIIDGRSDFVVMQSYYRMFPHEMSTKQGFSYDLPTITTINQMTYEKLLDKMIELRTNTPAIDNFVIVVHGLHDAKDKGWGLAIPLTDGTNMRCSYEVLQPLLERRGGAASGRELDDFESKYTYTNHGLGLVNVKYPAGSVARLIGKMSALQALKVRIVELRACTLGNNVPGLTIMGQSFGARFIIGPDVHMFYVSIDVQRGFNKGAAFDKLIKLIPQARKFENPANSGEKLAIGVKRGGGVSFVTDVLVNTANLTWFTGSKIWADTQYRNGTGKPANFFMSGMDLLGGRYALPQEQAYSDHLIEAGPLAGNRI